MSHSILIFDSGVGGLPIAAHIRRLCPLARLIYGADTAAFPYGALSQEALITRSVAVIGQWIERYEPQLVVIACNTASTLILPALRAQFAAIPFVGTVPAIKPAAALTRSGLISVLATPGTVQRDYTQQLIHTHAQHAQVTLVGSTALAPWAEAKMRGEPVDVSLIVGAIAPAFTQQDERRTDVVVLACTHYPLLLDEFRACAPWPVEWIDPAPAIAQRTYTLLETLPEASSVRHDDEAVITSEVAPPGLQRCMAAYGFSKITPLKQ